MQYEQTEYVGDVQILKRKPKEAIPMALDFSSVSDRLQNGKKVVKARKGQNPNYWLHIIDHNPCSWYDKEKYYEWEDCK